MLFTLFFAILILFSIFLYLLYRLVKAIEIITHAQDDPLSSGRKNNIGSLESNDTDELYDAAVKLLKDKEAASASLFQRKLNIGYARASRILDELEANGIVGYATGAKPRKVLKHT